MLLNYREMASEVTQSLQQSVIYYYYILKSTPGAFKIEPVEEVKAFYPILTTGYRPYLHLQYKTKSKLSWSTSTQSSFKNNAYYFKTKQDAEQHMKANITKAKRHFEGLIESSQEALDILKNY